MKSLLIAIFIFSLSAHAETCAYDLGASAEPTEIIAYLNALLNEQILNLNDLAAIADRIEAGESLQNSISIGRSTAERIHSGELEIYLSRADVNIRELRDWIHAKIAQSKKLGSERADIRQVTQLRQMHFIRVQGTGSFNRMREHSFEVMDTPVTQWMWVQLMGENPSFHKNGAEMQPDHPVESVTWFSAAFFANRLSRKMGLKPYYDFLGCSFEGRAESGTLALIDRTQLLEIQKYIFEGQFSPPLEEGYRLTAAAENAWIDDNFDKASRNVALQKPWFSNTSRGRTHPVAKRKPQVICGQEIFDFLGNVKEWQTNIGLYGLTNGGGFKSEATFHWHDEDINPSDSANDIGFRLVRTVK